MCTSSCHKVQIYNFVYFLKFGYIIICNNYLYLNIGKIQMKGVVSIGVFKSSIKHYNLLWFQVILFIMEVSVMVFIHEIECGLLSYILIGLNM